jgi:hypothetical protein
MFIYMIVNRLSGKYYIGQHKGKSLQAYLGSKLWDSRHQRSGRSYLYNSMRKYPDSSVWSIHALLSDIQTKTELDQYEKDFIAFLRSQNPEYGYNICRGGEGFSGRHSESTRLKIAANSRHMWQQPGHRENFSVIMTGHPTSPETVGKIKAARAIQDEAPRIKGCQDWAKEHPEEASARLSHEAHVLGGKVGSRENKRRAGILGAANGGVKARHTRWHTNRGQLKPDCPLCTNFPSL